MPRRSRVVLCAFLVCGCSDERGLLPDAGGVGDASIYTDGALTDGGSGGDGSTTTGDGASVGDGRKPGDGAAPKGDLFRIPDGWNPGNQPSCNGTVYKCSNGKDDDGDGKIDAQDPECIGPCDDDEGSFGTGIPGDNVDACKQDCFFDGNSGSGGDKCEWNLKCDAKNPGAKLPKPCLYDPNYKNCPGPQTDECRRVCQPLTPNGCDCFGCCEVYSAGKKWVIFLGSGAGCSAATPQNCATCTPVASCMNPCGECQLCLGKTIADLPAKCFPKPADAGVPRDGGAGTRDGGGTIIWPFCLSGTPCFNNSYCPTGQYCITGCCKKFG
ncbi:MAG: hypothetical protein IT371_18655 [Deltaproteobacteria bacterium]|nr:hypothetical protein [Deltaproteobacteria bacterium]